MSIENPQSTMPFGRQAGLAVITLILISIAGISTFFLPPETMREILSWLSDLGNHPAAPFVAVGLFAVLTFAGLPQAVVIVALVAALGPLTGFGLSWIGKLIACSAGFYIGRRLGSGWLAAATSEDVRFIITELARHGFWASAVVRLVPTVPSTLINVAAGCTSMRFSSFFLGTGLGSVPKMLLIALAGHSAISGLQGGGALAWISVVGAILLLVLIGIIGRSWLKHNAAADRRGLRQS